MSSEGGRAPRKVRIRPAKLVELGLLPGTASHCWYSLPLLLMLTLLAVTVPHAPG